MQVSDWKVIFSAADINTCLGFFMQESMVLFLQPSTKKKFDLQSFNTWHFDKQLKHNLFLLTKSFFSVKLLLRNCSEFISLCWFLQSQHFMHLLTLSGFCVIILSTSLFSVLLSLVVTFLKVFWKEFFYLLVFLPCSK